MDLKGPQMLETFVCRREAGAVRNVFGRLVDDQHPAAGRHDRFDRGDVAAKSDWKTEKQRDVKIWRGKNENTYRAL